MNASNYRGQAAARPVHGGVRPAQLRELGLEPADVLDFSASVCPLGPPPGLWDALRAVDLTAYPDPECLELKEALAREHGVEIDHVLVGNGSTELIHLLSRAFLPQPATNGHNTALVLTPTYGEYAGACSLMGAEIMYAEACREKGFAWRLSQVGKLIADRRPALVFLCNPNNPTGVYLDREEVAGLVRSASRVGTLVVVDEAYVNFVEDRWHSTSLLRGDWGDGVVLLRSMTKDYALTGLRLGYAVARPQVIARLAQLQPDWSVNSLAQVAGLVALADTGYGPASRQAVKEAKDFLVESFQGMGFHTFPSTANYLLVEVGDGSAWSARLARRGIFVRDCASFGLPDCIRIGIRALPDCHRLFEAMNTEIGGR